MIIRNCLYFLPIFLMIVSDYKCANGQRILWLFTLPQSSQSTPTFPYSSFAQGHNFYETVTNPRSLSRGSRFIFGDFFAKNRVHDQSHSGPFYQRSTPNEFPSPPPIQHLLIKEDGSASDMIWQEYDSKRRNKVTEAEIKPVIFENDSILKQEDQVVRKKDENRDSSSIVGNGSGSTTFSLMPHPLPFHEESGDKLTTATSVKPNMRCIQPHLEGNQARYDPVTGKCYTIGTRGPCGKMMIFIAVPGDNFNGICSCDYDSFDRPLVPVGGQCHFLYTQSICRPGYWLTSVTSSLEPVCELNPCYNSPHRSSKSSQSDSNPVVFFKGECISLNSPSTYCRRDGEVVLFPRGSSEPKCGFHPKTTKRIHRRQISNIRLFRCRPGERRSRITKKCARQTKTYFA